MNRLVIAAATAAAACGVAIPTFAGLAGNPSFSQHIPVRLPSSAQVVQFDTAGSVVRQADDRRSPSAVPSASRTAEPGDDHGGNRTSASTEPGDDRGSDNRGSGGHGSDDHGGGHGSDDGGYDD